MKINPEFQNLIPPLTAEEKEQLEANIRRDGCLHPLITWNGTLLDGYNRYEICERLHLPYKHEPIELPSIDAAKIWIINNQLGRRNLQPFQRIELALKLKPLIAAQAKENQQKGGGAVRQKTAQPVKTRDELAKKAGLSHDTIRKSEVILERAPEEVKEKLRKGQTTINKVYEAVKPRKHKPLAVEFVPIESLKPKAAGNGDAKQPDVDVKKAIPNVTGTTADQSPSKERCTVPGCDGEVFIRQPRCSMHGAAAGDATTPLVLFVKDIEVARRRIGIFLKVADEPSPGLMADEKELKEALTRAKSLVDHVDYALKNARLWKRKRSAAASTPSR